MLVTLRAYDPDGDPLNTTLHAAPTCGAIFDLFGRQILEGELINDGGANADGVQVMYVLDEAYSPTEDAYDNFSYAVTDGGEDGRRKWKRHPLLRHHLR